MTFPEFATRGESLKTGINVAIGLVHPATIGGVFDHRFIGALGTYRQLWPGTLAVRKKEMEMKTMTIRTLTVLMCALTLAGCTSTVATDTPGVDQPGKYIVRQEGPELDTVLGTRFAALNPGQEWLILEVAFSSPAQATARIERSKVFVKTPAGERIPLATQSEFANDYSSLQAAINKANVVRDPMDYFPPSRLPCKVTFFSAPGQSVVYDEVSVNNRRVCSGRLFFKVPGGTQTGRWSLGIDLEESTVRLPFNL